MKKVVDNTRLMIKVCDLYYNQNISQQEIGKQLNLSRPTVSRLLSSARELGIVQIRIPNLEAVKYWEIERQIEEKYKLKDVMIVDAQSNHDQLLDKLGRAAANYISYIIKSDDKVGISMGSTLYQMTKHIYNPAARNVTFIPLIGGLGQLRTELHSNSLAESLAKVYNGSFTPIYAPARVSSISIRNELMREEAMAKPIQLMKDLDVAIVGIGYPNDRSSISATGYFKENEMDELIKKDVAGDICMQFFDENGDTKPFKNDNFVVGININKLKKVPISIGIAGGIEKLPSIKGAIRGGFINRLITDIQCASLLASE